MSKNKQQQIVMNGDSHAQAPVAMCPHHGKPLRGLMSTPKSRSFEGRFGRMFPLSHSLQAASYGKTDAESQEKLKLLGKKMTSGFDKPKDDFDAEESGIPALYTYFGQFVDHDITFDPVTTLTKHNDPDAITDFRTPALDLDNVYGRGPSDQPYLYNNKGNKFLLGQKLDNGALDLQRNNDEPARALIGDPRNDENSIVSQFQGLMLRFHNRVVDDHPELDFDSIQETVRWHYQWVIIHDFLPRLICGSVLDALKTDGRYDQEKLKFYHWKNDPFIPVEFSVAAYRLGHSMVRPGYRLNSTTLLPIFPTEEAAKEGFPGGLTGFQAIPKDHGIDWWRFIDIGKPLPYLQVDRLQFAYRIDTGIVNPLSFLPESVALDAPPSLAERNLLRGFELGLPSGQSVARAMGVVPLRDDQIIIGKAVDEKDKGPGDVLGPLSNLIDLATFRGNCPLWTYILAEAANNKKPVLVPVTPRTEITTPQLGPVGGRIVAEVFLGMLFGDPNSFLRADPKWTPTIGNARSSFALRDLVAYALGQ